ncbi:MAG: hypothetical protein E7200_03815 [Selenomonas ruminantium]|nr:hypothetical protein [Selenomonas ruminantium]
MNSKAEQFQQYLQEKKIEAFAVDELKDDEMGTVVFRSHMDIEGQQLPTLVILDNSIFVQIRVVLLKKARSKEKELEVFQVLNEENMKYKPFKLYFSQEGDCILDVSLVTEQEKLSGDMVYTMFKVLIDYLNENYRKIMKAIW